MQYRDYRIYWYDICGMLAVKKDDGTIQLVEHMGRGWFNFHGGLVTKSDYCVAIQA